ncbi:histidine N-alpha-methyltransferase [Rhizocola hellebori]|uniref:Histidine N-alpha-methyltransferase n=1 Tax=Rhizocola hellebori TaxID=1392758 RepID=A0A8J3VGL6_9ACTN|nr:L-histidine N(alpha)-methyltransferase [Rhizocola hellebori]GIH05171.1 histidine N-alpha-methyltransferase [Rhizocola hellebori]
MKFDIYLTEADLAADLRHDVQCGLSTKPKTLPPKWFYDEAGSELFELITKLPEYYPTGCERAILSAHADDIASITSATTVVELGSGSSDKTRLLLEAFGRHGTLRGFVPIDVSASMLEMSAEAIAADFPWLQVHAIVGDFLKHLGRIPDGANRLVVFLGGTIGNLMPHERAEFLTALRGTLRDGEWLLLGTDLVKPLPTLIDAYDDSSGVTAEFNRNVLRVINRELGADFDVEAFAHVAVWNVPEQWIEMRLRAQREMTVNISRLGLTVHFDEDEELRTEISAKFRRHGIAAELERAGFASQAWWTDPAGRFGVTLAQAQ